MARKWAGTTLRTRAYEVFKLPHVNARLQSLLKVEADALVADRVELARYLTRVIRTAIGDVSEKSDLAQEKTVRVTREGSTITIKLPCKLGAVQALARMLGYDEPAKGEVVHRFEPDSAVMESLRRHLPPSASPAPSAEGGDA